MLDVIFLRLRVKGLRKSIAVSDKLPARAWAALAVVFFLLLCMSFGFLLNDQSSPTSKTLVLLTDQSESAQFAERWKTAYFPSGEYFGVVTPRVNEITPTSAAPHAMFTLSANGPQSVVPGQTVTITFTTGGTTGFSSALTVAFLHLDGFRSRVHLGSDYQWPTNGTNDHLHMSLFSNRATADTQNVYYIQAAPEQQKSDTNMPLWIATIVNALGTLTSSYFLRISNRRQEKQFQLQELETRLKLKEMELKIMQLQLELDRAKSQPLIVPA